MQDRGAPGSQLSFWPQKEPEWQAEPQRDSAFERAEKWTRESVSCSVVSDCRPPGSTVREIL